MTICTTCRGTGHTGEVLKTIPDHGYGENKTFKPCSDCGGTGKVEYIDPPCDVEPSEVSDGKET